MNAELPAPGEVIVWDFLDLKKRSRTEHDDRVFGIGFAPDGALATAGWDGSVKLWKRGTVSQPAVSASPAAPELPLAGGKKNQAPGTTALLRKDYPREFRHALKGAEVNQNDLALYGPDASQCVIFETEGMRITLPTDYPGQRPGTGLATEFGVKGDFEITVNFEILQSPSVKEPGQRTEFVLLVAPAEMPRPDVWFKANQNRASLARQAEDRDNISRYLVTTTKWHEESFADKFGNENFGKKEQITTQTFPTGTTKGRLRLVRAGAVLHFLAAEDGDDDFELLHSAEFGVKDLKSVRLTAATGGPNAAFDVRITDLRIHAEGFTHEPAMAPAARLDRKLVLFFVISGSVLLAGAGLAYVILRRRMNRSMVRVAPDAAPLVFSCACGKSLKVRSQLVGKKVKCPQCGTVTFAPETGA